MFPSLSSGPRCSASWSVWTRRIFRHVQGLVCWYLTMSLALCSSWLSQAQDARHHGRHGPQDSYVEVHRCSWCAMSGARQCRKLFGDSTGAAHHQGHGSHCSAAHRDSTVAVPQQGVDLPVIGPHRSSSSPSVRRDRFPWSHCSADHGDSPVAVH